MSKSFKSKSTPKTRERRYEKVNNEGDVIEVIEETVPGGVEAYGNMLIRIENHNLYESGIHNLPDQLRLREILKKKKCKICGKINCQIDHEAEERRKKKLEEERRRREEEERRRKLEEERKKREE